MEDIKNQMDIVELKNTITNTKKLTREAKEQNKYHRGKNK